MVARNPNLPMPQVSALEVLEKTLIKSMLLYGSRTEQFDDEVLKEDEKGQIFTEKRVQELKVYEKIFLELQQDELAFTNPLFQDLFQSLVTFFASSPDQRIEYFIRSCSSEGKQAMVDLISSLLLEEEQFVLHDWERKNIFAKPKEHSVDRLVTETILSLRSHLLSQQIKALQEASKTDDRAIEEVMDYLQLNQVLNKKLNRVLSF